MEFWFIVYIIVSIITILGSFYLNFVSGKRVQGAILGVGFLAASITFGIRWFTPSGTMTGGVLQGPWPPSMNTCPDYLSTFKVGNETVCVDTVGVSRGKMKRCTDATQTDEDYVFHLHLNEDTATRIQSICQECEKKGVTWEGVWNGSMCLGREPPKP